jgi:hypothetical protein
MLGIRALGRALVERAAEVTARDVTEVGVLGLREEAGAATGELATKGIKVEESLDLKDARNALGNPIHDIYTDPLNVAPADVAPVRPSAITPPTNRGGLRTAMGEPPPGLANPQVHHDLPWTLRDWFAGEGRGLNVNDPAFGRWVSGTPPGGHQRWTAAFEAEWRGFIGRNPNASRQEALGFMNHLRADPRFH